MKVSFFRAGSVIRKSSFDQRLGRSIEWTLCQHLERGRLLGREKPQTLTTQLGGSEEGRQ